MVPVAALADTGAMAATDIARQVVSAGLGSSAGAEGLGRAEETWLPAPPPPPRGGQWAALRSQGTAALMLSGSAAQSPNLFPRMATVAGWWRAWLKLRASG